MHKQLKVTAIVPALNEADNILNVIRTMPSFVDHIVVVDDGSKDRTAELAMRSGDDRVIVVTHERRLGVGGAIITGHKRAFDLRSDVNVVMAGDGQMDPAYLPILLDTIAEQGYDYAKGNRFLKRGHLKTMPRLRVFGNFILTFLTKLVSGYWHIFDPQNGYTAIKTSVLRDLDLDHIAKGYFFENDMLIHLNILGARVKDVPIPSCYNMHVHSKIKLLKFIPSTLLLFASRFFYRIYRKYVLYDFRPFALFFFPGLALFAWGFLYGLCILMAGYLMPALLIPSTGTVMLAVLPFMIGFQLLLIAFLIDILETPK